MAKQNKIPTPVVENAGVEVENEEVQVEKTSQPLAATEVRDAARAVKAKELKNAKLKKKPAIDEKIKVVAIDRGYYNNQRKKPGMKFTIRSMSEFSVNWMELI
jgi:hypothetical protein